ncbi:MAG TPA: helix-turn-helix transcriptional regulator [Phycisphaerales bacterium]|nr:helix-turn-helix transcriptional regulator [Phycisphaerales bacterium]
MAKTKQAFGTLLREKRLAKGYSLRKFAEMVGVSPTYLSLIEQGKLEHPPTAERVRVMAKLLGEDPDHWIGLAGRVPDDMEAIIRNQPEAMPALLRAAKGLTADELRKLAEQLRRKSEDKKKE